MTADGSRDKRKAEAKELRGDGKHSSVTLPVASATVQDTPPGPKFVKPKLDVECTLPSPRHAPSLQLRTSQKKTILREKTFNLKLSGNEVYYKVLEHYKSRSCGVVSFHTRKFLD